MPYKEITRDVVNRESWKIFRTKDEHLVAVRGNSQVICHDCNNEHLAASNMEDFILEPHNYSELKHISGVPEEKEGFSYYSCLRQGMRCRLLNRNAKNNFMVVAIEDGCITGRR